MFVSLHYFSNTWVYALGSLTYPNMKISLDWIKEYLNTNIADDTLVDLLTDIGLEVEGLKIVESVRGGLRGLVIGEVISKTSHPNADKLSLTQVNIGQNTPLAIVCGAANVATGQKVVVATEGATLYPTAGEPFTIKKGKIRGEVSEGMICAEDEIGLGTSHEGIMVLPADAPVGQAFAAYKGVCIDKIIDINLTPNRSDAMGHLGVAFDLAAAVAVRFGQKNTFQRPSISRFESLANNKSFKIRASVAQTDSCPRYSGVCIQNLKVAESPEWLKTRLQALGVNPINNVVDVTNFVLHEMGQPLHAFDYRSLSTQNIEVKTLDPAPKFTLLDGREIQLDAQDLLICDGNNPLGIAGVMGGKASGVQADTTTIFLESAHFQPKQTRRTSMRHQLRTDAATRFEKGTDPNATLYALKRAALLIMELAGGELASEVLDIYPNPVKPAEVVLHFANIERLLGIHIPQSEVLEVLAALEMEVLEQIEGGLRLAIPTNKSDVDREADVLEEILRIYGYNRVENPKQLVSVLSFEPRPNPVRARNRIAELLSARGLSEMMSLSLTRSEYFRDYLPLAPENLVLVNNTSNQHLDLMRPSMLFSGLEAILHNQNRQNHHLQAYEFGKIYTQTSNQKYQEQARLAIFVTGDQYPTNWLHKNSPHADFYYVKSLVELVLARFGIAPNSYQSNALSADPQSPWAYGLVYGRGKQDIVRFGRVAPQISKGMGIRQAVFYADFDWDVCLKTLEKQNIRYTPLAKYPAVHRDLSMLVDEQLPFAKIIDTAQRQSKKLLQHINLFDVYSDDKLKSEGKKSVALSFVFQDPEKTLTDKDIEQAVAGLIQAFEKQIAAIIRK